VPRQRHGQSRRLADARGLGRSLVRQRTRPRKHGNEFAVLTSDDAWSEAYWAKGFRLFAVGIDSLLLQAGIRQGIGKLDALGEGRWFRLTPIDL
jgi:hypothetical protein